MQYKLYKTPPYSSREQRAKFAYIEYANFFGESVLDVGGFQGALKQIFKGKYINVDINDNADCVLDIDNVDRLPFNDKEFDTVVCTDVLEHLENIHFIFDEICRIANKSIIISMPNAWNNVRYIVGGIRSQFSKKRPRCLSDRHWTLPIDKPTDRHRWFYSLSEANAMITYRGTKMGFEVAKYNPHIIAKNRLSLSNIIRTVHKIFWSKEDFVNFYAYAGWWVLCRIKNE